MRHRFCGTRVALHFALVLSLVASAQAEPLGAPAATPSPEQRDEARVAFSKGAAALKKRRYAEAISQFRIANQLIPHPLTSFNLGFAHAKQKQWLEAEPALATYLASSPSDAQKRAEAEVLYREVLANVSVVFVSTSPPGAMISIGERQVTSPARIVLLPGRYPMQISLAGHDPVTRPLDLVAGENPLVVSLNPTITPVGSIELTCNFPAVETRLDGELVPQGGQGGQGAAVLQRPVGDYVARFTRPGYEASVHSLRVAEGATATATCDMSWDESPEPEHVGRLVVTSPAGSRLKIDGRPAAMNVSVPIGPHTLTLDKAGYRTWRGDVEIEPRQTTAVAPELQAMLTVEGGSSDGSRTWAWVTGIGGIAAAAAGTGLYLAADGEFSTWRRRQDELDGLWAGATPSELGALGAEQSDNDARASTVNTFDGVAIGCYVGAGLLLATSAVLWIVGDDPAPPDTISLGPNVTGARFRF